MRFTLALLVASLLIAPGMVAEEGEVTPQHGCDGDPDNPDCHDHDSPGLGVVAAVGLLGAVAFLARRRMQ